MANKVATARYGTLTRCLAALALLFVYFASTSAILVGASTTAALARGRGGGGRGFRGRGFRGRGYVRGYVGPRGGCFWDYRWQRWICPYY